MYTIGTLANFPLSIFVIWCGVFSKLLCLLLYQSLLLGSKSLFMCSHREFQVPENV